MSVAPAQPDYRLTFRPTSAPVPAIARLKRLLKYAKRAVDLRCVRAEEVVDHRERAMVFEGDGAGI